MEFLEDRAVPAIVAGPLTSNLPHDTPSHVIDTEGQQVVNVAGLPLLQFEDTDNTLANLSGTIHWGDGTIDNFDSTGTGSVQIIATNQQDSLNNNAWIFQVIPTASSHIYEDFSGPISNAFSITVTDSSDNSTATDARDFGPVADAPLLNVTNGTPVAVTDGNATGPVVLGTFTDAGNGEGLSVSIDWGDGVTTNDTTSGSIVPLGNNQFEIDSTGYTYLDEGSYTITAHVTDEGGATAIAPTTPATVTLNATGQPVMLTEGTPALVPVATFTDPGDTTAAIPGNTTVAINWGDGSPLDTTSGGLNYDGTTYTVLGTHIYHEESAPDHAGSEPYPITVYITHDGVTTTVNSGATVQDAPVTLLGAIPSIIAVEGQDTGPLALAAFTDPSPELPGDYSATIDWGDGHTTAGAISVSGNTIDVTGGHVYAEESTNNDGGPGDTGGVYHVSITLSHENTTPVTANTTATVSDPPVTVTAAAGPFTATEGSVSSPQIIATFNDPGDPNGNVEALSDYTIMVDWGNGTFVDATGDPNVTVTANGNGNYTITAAHDYLEEEGFSGPLQVQVVHENVNSNIGQVPLTLTDPAVVLNSTLISLPGIGEGQSTGQQIVATFTDPGNTVDPGADAGAEYSATIHWGDGTPTDVATVANGGIVFGGIAGSGATIWAVVGTHTYAEESTNPPDHFASADGSFHISVSVDHEGVPTPASGTTDTATVVVADPAVTGWSSSPDTSGGGYTVNASEGGSGTGQVLLATFTDPANPTGSLESGNYSADINWGDSAGVQLNSGTISYDSTNHVFDVYGSHVYSDEDGSPYPVTVTIYHENTTPLVVTDTATIADADTPVANATQPTLAALNEGAPSGTLTTLATFTDNGYPNNDPGDFSVSIDWGDNSPLDTTTGSVSGDRLGNLTVSSTGHSYVEEGTYTVRVTIIDDGTATSVTATNTIAVTDPAPVVTPAANLKPVEGQSLTNVPVATFTDPGGPETPADYAALINWGDGTSGPGTITGPDGNGVFTVLGSHTYAEESGAEHSGSNPYQIGVGVAHDNLLVNGSFEQPVGAGGYATIPGWTLAPGTGGGALEIADTNIGAAYDGNQFLELNSNGPGTISQTITTVPGQTYLLGFAFSARQGTSPADNDMAVVVNGTPLTTITLDGSSQLTGTAWNYYSFPVTATSASTTIEFDSLSPAGDGEGGELDAVTFAPLTAPATLTANVSDPALTLVSNPATLPGINEGQNTGFQALATFTDPGGPETPGDYSATVTWGDGTSSSTSDGTGNVYISGPDGNGNFTVYGAHTYTEESVNNDHLASQDVFTITTTMTHENATPDVVSTSTITVDELAPVASGVTALSATETVPFTQALATFTDPGGPEALADYTATVTWGDGQTSSSNDGTGTVSISGPDVNGVYTVTGTHTYLEEDGVAGSIQVTITHEGTTSNTINDPLTVIDPALTNVQPTAITPIEGQPGTFLVATFEDPGNPGNVSTDFPNEYGAAINWGDGSPLDTTSATFAYSGSGDTYDVYATHTYQEESGAEHAGSTPYQITVQLDHEDTEPPAPVTTTATVSDPAVMVSPGPSASGVEGQPTNSIVLASFTDPGDNGFGVASVAITDGGFGYQEETPTVTFTGGGGTGAAGQAVVDPNTGSIIGVLITNPGAGYTAPPIVTFSAPLYGSYTATGVANLAPNSEPLADYAATVDWGDGTSASTTDPNPSIFIVPAGSVPNEYLVIGSHTYAQDGPYSATTTVQHESAPAAQTSVTVNVADAQLTNLGLVGNALPPTALEEAPLGPLGMIAQFVDPAGMGKETPADFTATISWGDGTSSPALVQLDPNGGGVALYDVLDTTGHTYAADGTYAVSVTVQHDSLAPVTSTSQTITVNDQAITLGLAPQPFVAVEGQPSALQAVATFTDPGGAEAVGNYSALITWGDHTTSPGLITYSTGIFTVWGSHTYAEDTATASYALAVTVTHGGISMSGSTASVMVADPSVLAVGGLTLNANEGGTLPAGQLVAAFTDPGGAEAPGDYSADITFGDGNGVQVGAGTVTYDASSGQFLVTTNVASGVYSADGTATLVVTIHHDTAAAVTVSDTVAVADVAVSATGGLSIGALEGASSGLQTVATFTDPGGAELVGNYSALVNWGDNTAPTAGTITFANGTFTVQDGHTYAEEGTYSVSVTIGHGTTAAVTVYSTATVVDQPVSSVTDVSTNVPANLVEGQPTGTIADLADFTDPAGGGTENLGDFAAIINWGDGTQSDGQVLWAGSGSYQVDAPSHTYATAGQYTISVAVLHGGMNAVSSSGQNVTVSDPAVVALPAGRIDAVEGAPATLTVATFTDPGGAQAIGSYGATIDWGDGNSGPGTISLNGSVFTVTGTYRYAEESGAGHSTNPYYPVTVTITHGTTTPQTVIDSAYLSDPAVVASGDLTLTSFEKVTTGLITLATFTDPGGAELSAGKPAKGEYSAIVLWGDGGFSAGIITYDATAGNFVVQGKHIYQHLSLPEYTDDGSNLYPVTVLISHEGSTQQVVSDTMQVTPHIRLGGAGSIKEGQTAYTLYVYPGAEAGTYTIHWNDGSANPTSTVVRTTGGGTYFAVKHVFNDAGMQNVTVDFTLSAPGTADNGHVFTDVATKAVDVLEQPPSAAFSVNLTSNPLVFIGAGTSAPADVKAGLIFTWTLTDAHGNVVATQTKTVTPTDTSGKVFKVARPANLASGNPYKLTLTVATVLDSESTTVSSTIRLTTTGGTNSFNW